MTSGAAMTYRLYPGARLKHDRARDQFVLLKPEEVTELNPTAHEILSLCDGRSTDAIVSELQGRYPQADLAELGSDVQEFLQEALACQWIQAQP
jgi:pyrroloquinoline quinone biosynthesis protein D